MIVAHIIGTVAFDYAHHAIFFGLGLVAGIAGGVAWVSRKGNRDFT